MSTFFIMNMKMSASLPWKLCRPQHTCRLVIWLSNEDEGFFSSHISNCLSFYGLFLRVEPIMECAEELEVDIPLLWKYLAEMMGQSAFDGNLNLDKLLLDCVLKYVSKQKAAKLFFHLLETAANDTVSPSWHFLGISVSALVRFLNFCLLHLSSQHFCELVYK